MNVSFSLLLLLLLLIRFLLILARSLARALHSFACSIQRIFLLISTWVSFSLSLHNLSILFHCCSMCHTLLHIMSSWQLYMPSMTAVSNVNLNGRLLFAEFAYFELLLSFYLSISPFFPTCGGLFSLSHTHTRFTRN